MNRAGDSVLTHYAATRNSSSGPYDRPEVDAAIRQFEPVVAAAMTRAGVPGVAIAIISRDTVVYSRGFGVRKVGEPEAVDARGKGDRLAFGFQAIDLERQRLRKSSLSPFGAGTWVGEG